MLLVKLTDGVPDKYPITLENFLLLFPATSFPGYLDASITEPLGFGIYTFTPMPTEYDKSSEKPDEGLPVRNDETGVWEQQWNIRPLTQAEKYEVDEEQRREVRFQRGMRLQGTDWTQLPDAPISEELKAELRVYRQALRDLFNDPNFDIWNVVWPVPPSLRPAETQPEPDVVV
jgi:Phage tail assembly chaperone protein